jgi:hypothetical protein
MYSVQLRFTDRRVADVTLGEDLSVIDLQHRGFEGGPALRHKVGPTAVVEGRSRLGSLEFLNVNAFPFDRIPGVTDSGRVENRMNEDVTIQLAEGHGVACSWSTRLDALTIWWVTDAGATHRRECRFSSPVGSVSVPTVAMRGFSSATSDEECGTAICIAALSRSQVRTLLAGEDRGAVAAEVDSLSLEATVDLGESPRVVASRVRGFDRPQPELQAAVRDLPWLTLESPNVPVFCVNNHPAPQVPDDEPSEEPEAPEEDDESEETSQVKPWIDDFVSVRVPRSGRPIELFGPDDVACVAATSPTINCLTLYWLSELRNLTTNEVRAQVGDARLPTRHLRQQIRRSLTDETYLPVQLCSVQIPLQSLAEQLDRPDLLPTRVSAAFA